jgi:hypothetical protein
MHSKEKHTSVNKATVNNTYQYPVSEVLVSVFAQIDHLLFLLRATVIDQFVYGIVQQLQAGAF